MKQPKKQERVVSVFKAECHGCDVVETELDILVYGIMTDDTVMVLGGIPKECWYQMTAMERAVVVGKIKFNL